MPKTFAELLAAVPQATHLTGDGATLISAPVVESDADVQPGSVFVARAGLSVDGHDFIARAIERGAAAIVGEMPPGEKPISGLSVPYAQVENAQEAVGWLAAAYHDFPSRKLIVIGVTGTDGKTTTSTLIHSILNQTADKAGLISTIAAVIGDKTLDTGLHVTTPSAPQIQALLAQMVANGLKYAVLEMTSHGLAQGRLNGVDLDVAVLTNVTHEHLDYHGTFDNYRAAKGRMFAMLGQSVHKGLQRKIGIINADDSNADYFIKIIERFPNDLSFPFGNTLYGLYSEAIPTWNKPLAVRYEPDGTYISMPDMVLDILPFHEETTELYTPLVGEFNVMNVLAAICAASVVLSDPMFSVPLIQAGLKAVKAIPGRMERIDEGQDFLALVDFAHTPNALENVLKACRKMLPNSGRVIAVIGSAGLRDREKRRLMAEVATKLADFTVLTAEDPRTESLDDILETMAQASVGAEGVEGETFVRVPDRGQALYAACQQAKAGDIVIACGKGHEQSMAFGTVEYPWDDREALRAALRGTPLRTLPTA
ncbi:MAG: UDP-N-acetylmuramoyl-L-alanyl-D-glutamate--2,6-diaminopimelate ligase [Chloroflexota bacterium]